MTRHCKIIQIEQEFSFDNLDVDEVRPWIMIVQRLPWINYINVHPTATKNISSSSRKMKSGSCSLEAIHYLSFWSWPLLGKPFPSRCLSGGHLSPPERVSRKHVYKMTKSQEWRKIRKRYYFCKNWMEHVTPYLIFVICFTQAKFL